MSRAAVFVVAIFLGTPAWAETAYFQQVEDLPVAPGLAEYAERTEYSNADLRIVGASASGRADAEHVRAYYSAALPALGWAISLGGGGENETVYLRGREQLSLRFFQDGDQLRLNVLLFVRTPPSD